MKKTISMFIMDVSDSSKFENGKELTNYLSFWENTLNEMNDFISIKAKHRMGDEIICVVESYYAAILIANYIIYNWKYEKFMPYFGFSFGVVESEIDDIDIWNHPIIKEAREANDSIKKDSSRNSLMTLKAPINLDELKLKINNLNLIFDLQSNLIIQQTMRQREILQLYSLVDSQKKVAEILGITTATISSHYKRGATELILQSCDIIAESLILYQIKDELDQNIIKWNEDCIEKKENEYEFLKLKIKKIILKKIFLNNN